MGKGKFGGMGGGGGMNMQAMLRQAQKMQQGLTQAQEEIAKMETEASAGGGAVTAVMSGTTVLKSLTIKPEVIDPEDAEMLQDLVVAAVNEAMRQASEKSNSRMQQVSGGVSMPGLF